MSTTRPHAAPLLTNRATAVLAEAVQESRRLYHGSVGTEHLLIALLAEGGPVVEALGRLGVDVDALSAKVQERARAEPPVVTAMPLLLRIRRTIELAEIEAGQMRRPLGPEHLLLGLLAERDGLGPAVLHDTGLTLDAARGAIQKLT